MKRLLLKIKKIIAPIIKLRWLAWGVGFILPIKKNRIVVCVNSGGGFGDNPKYIVEDLLACNEKLDIIWLVNKGLKNDSLPKGVKRVNYNSFKAIIKLATAHVWIDNSRKQFLYKKKNTLYIQTWHGGGVQKKVEKAVEANLPKSYVKIAKKDSKYIDIFLSDCKATNDVIYNDYWYDRYILENYYPRNQIIIDSLTNEKLRSDIINKVYDFYNIDKSKKIILYAPTFRSNDDYNYFNLDFEALIKASSNRFKNNYVVLVRLHPNISAEAQGFKYNDIVINATSYPDPQELLVSTDILITDYSSINYDFSFTGRPSFRYAVDVCDYLKDRGFYYDFNEYPYPLATSNDELINIINNFSYEEFDDLNKFFKDKIGLCINSNDKKCSNLILDYVKGIKIAALEKKYELIHR